jgi:hypothetical protein
MKGTKRNITKEDFRRYLENQMTDAERNAFERLLQKNPFESEAIEGFERISGADFEKDLAELTGQVAPKKSSGNIRFRAAAAVVLLLISTGILWYVQRDQSLIPQVSETKITHEEEKENVPEPAQPRQPTAPVKKNTETVSFEKQDAEKVRMSPAIAASKGEEKNGGIALVSESRELVENIVEIKEEPLAAKEKMPEIENPMAAVLANVQKLTVSDSSTAQKSRIFDSNRGKTIRGKVISTDDNQPMPGVTIVQKGTAHGTITDVAGNFTMQLRHASDSILIASFVGMEEREFRVKKDTELIVRLEPSQLALDEMVVVGYGVSTKEAPTTDVIQEASPKIGAASFRKYMDEKAILPVDYTEKKVIVKVGLKIDAQGNVVSVENVGQAEPSIFNMARKLILEGPVWNPRRVNGTPVESEMTWRLIFKKQK